jgi:hypothetical protein
LAGLTVLSFLDATHVIKIDDYRYLYYVRLLPWLPWLVFGLVGLGFVWSCRVFWNSLSKKRIAFLPMGLLLPRGNLWTTREVYVEYTDISNLELVEASCKIEFDSSQGYFSIWQANTWNKDFEAIRNELCWRVSVAVREGTASAVPPGQGPGQ